MHSVQIKFRFFFDFVEITTVITTAKRIVLAVFYCRLLSVLLWYDVDVQLKSTDGCVHSV